MKTPKFTVSQVIDALQKFKGCIYLAANELRCHRDTIGNYMQRHPEVRAAVEAEKGKLLDTAELSLANAILKGESWAICFFLKTQGKHRGYIERNELALSGNVELEVVERVITTRKEAQENRLTDLSGAGRVSGRNGFV